MFTERPKTLLADAEREFIELALAENGGNQTRAAARLGMCLRTLTRRLKKWKKDDALKNKCLHINDSNH